MNLVHIANRVEMVNYWLGLLLNLLLIFLILKVRKGESAYKALQFTFVMNDLAYATISYALGDKFITKGHSFAMFLIRANNLHLICIFASSFASILVVVCYNFLYRYWAVVSPQRIKLFSTKWFPLFLAALSLTVFAIWYCSCFFLLVANDEARRNLIPEFKRKYGIDAMTHAMVLADYYRDGHYNIRPLAGVGIFLTIICIGLSFMVFCMVSILRYLSQSLAISARTKQLQYALFRTLTVQTIVPVVFLHANAGQTILMPLFGIDVSMMCDWISVGCSCFPPFDAIATILLMKDYRNAVWALATCRPSMSRALQSSVSKVSPVSLTNVESRRPNSQT